MNTLPPELLGPIFRLACTDGGRTGCSLSLTSKYLRAASRSTRFHTVALVSGDPSQVVQFLALYTTECEGEPDSKPRVRHLCLSAAQPEASSVIPFPNDGGSTAASDGSEKGGQATESQKQAQRYLRDAISLIQMLAPDLETLCFVDPTQQGIDTLHIPTLRSAGFPSLVELAIIGTEPTIVATSDACVPFCPRLRTLHRIFLPRLVRLHHFADTKDPMFRKWKERAPGLDNIRIVHMSGLRYEGSMKEILKKVLRNHKVQLSSTLTKLIAPEFRRRRRLFGSPGARGYSSDPRG